MSLFQTQFADVILPVPLPKLFTYEVPTELMGTAQIGSRVIVPFGKQKIQTGIINKLHAEAPSQYESKQILEVMDQEPVVTEIQLKLFHWVAQYYMCTLGEVINAAIPSGLKLSSESFVQINPEYLIEDNLSELSDREYDLVKGLETTDQLSYSEIGQLLGIKSIYHLLKSLSSKGAVIIFEQVKEKYKPKKINYVRLNPDFLEEESALEALFQKLEKRPKQLEVLLRYIQHVPILEKPEANNQGIKKSDLVLQGLSESSYRALVKNGVLEVTQRNVSRLEQFDYSGVDLQLSELQQFKLEEIKKNFGTHSTVLFQGVTGSGKTEIYIELIKSVRDQGKQALYLLPEIALTTQIVSRLRKVFGNHLGVYHSKYSDNERVEVWLGLLSGRYDIIVGVRSAVLLPFQELGLIIVDEEYESTFKQYEPAPRYHARDLAIVLSKHTGASVLLGTATPSFESYQNALEGKYGYVELTERYGQVHMPSIALVDIKEQRKRKLMKNEFTSAMLEEIQQTLDQKEQVIIFQNRRGYAPLLSCEDCGHTPKCHQCSVSLTYHQFGQELKCHYCGYREPLPQSCDACGSARLKTVGFGTEKLEEDLSLFFPTAVVQRMDLDTTRSKYGYQHILEAFQEGRINILVGTQMITKGLDFERVGLVGVVDADRMIQFPDFRSHERAFQMITQVSGRAGRRDRQGKVVVQTYNPQQPILADIMQSQFDKFYQREAAERRKYHYPPFYRLIKVIIRHKDREACRHVANYYASAVKTELGDKRVLGPEEPLIARIRNQYHQVINVKLEKAGINLGRAKKILQNLQITTLTKPEFAHSIILFDVDPH